MNFSGGKTDNILLFLNPDIKLFISDKKTWWVVIMEILSSIIFKFNFKQTQIYFKHIDVFMMLWTIIMTTMMMTIISDDDYYKMPTVSFATHYSTCYSDFLLQPYSNPTRSKKRLLALCRCLPSACHTWIFQKQVVQHLLATHTTRWINGTELQKVPIVAIYWGWYQNPYNHNPFSSEFLQFRIPTVQNPHGPN